VNCDHLSSGVADFGARFPLLVNRKRCREARFIAIGREFGVSFSTSPFPLALTKMTEELNNCDATLDADVGRISR